MTRRLIFVFTVFISLTGFAVADSQDYVPGQILVRFDQQDGQWPDTAEKLSTIDSVIQGCSIQKEFNIVPGLSLVILPTGTSVQDAVCSVSASSGILYAEPNYRHKIDIVPNDLMFDGLWGMHNTGQTGGAFDADIDGPEAWNIHTGSKDIIVAVTDTGIDYDHVDLAANMWINEAEFNGQAGTDDDNNGYIDDIYGIDAVNNDTDPMDDHMHGTHVAGTVGAVGNNGEGVAGVCWNVRIMATKCFDAEGAGAAGAEIACIEYAVEMGARVINASWGGYLFSEALYNTLQAVEEAGVLFVTSAGNENNDNDGTLPAYPASYDLDNIIAVMSTDHNDDRSDFSNYGLTTVDIAAPGENILSCLVGGGYIESGGTSMSSPHVAGACALFLSAAPQTNYLQVKNTVMMTADPVPSLAGWSVTGARLNIFNMLDSLGDYDPPEPDPAEWEIKPGASGLHTIGMRATVAEDPSGVEYYFKCTTDINFDSGWQDSRLYTRDDYASGTIYKFRVRARDKSTEQNETGWSTEASTQTASPVDNLPPWPNPSRWKALPRQLGTQSIIAMEAMAGFDENGVEYYFDCDNDAFDRDWDDSPIYAIYSGLVVGNTYSFAVITRDKVIPSNEGMPSVAASVTLQPQPKQLDVPFPYATIQDAVDAANDGDTIIVHPGIYTGQGNRDIDFLGKEITLRCEDPDNPDIVASTIIDCDAGPIYEELYPGFFLYLGLYDSYRAFIFQNSEGRDSVVEGFTITNGYIREGGDENAWAVGTYLGIPTGTAGGDGVDAFGGAVLCLDSSPTFRECIISNCVVDGSGGNGAHGDGATDPNDGVVGGDGGDNAKAYGGAFYCDSTSSPLIENCTISNCTAISNGGNGGDGDINDLFSGVGGDGGNIDGSAIGGAIYCERGGSVTIINSSISNCSAYAPLFGLWGWGTVLGMEGSGDGVGQAGAVHLGGDSILQISNCIIDGNTAGHNAGSLYLADLCNVDIADSTIRNNKAGGSGGAIYFESDAGKAWLFDCLLSRNSAGGDGGAIYYLTTNNTSDPNYWLSIVNCDIEDNSTYVNHTSTSEGGVGGALYLGDITDDPGITSAFVQIIDSRINNNESEYGGAVCAVNTDLKAYGSTFNQNTAEYGGGIFTHECIVDIDTCLLNHNVVELAGGVQNYASGGAAYFLDSSCIVISSIISVNSAEGYGAGLYFAGFETATTGPQDIINCLITENTAGIAGAGLSSNVSAYPLLDNCTVVGNYVSDVIGAGGGVSCYSAFVQLKNSILWDNNAVYGQQIAVGEPAELYNPFSTVLVTYCDTQGGADDVFIGQGEGPLLIYDYVTNISDDPLFVSTISSDDPAEITYYLSDVEAGQLQTSPCIDQGSDDVAELVALLGFEPTTRTNHDPDTGDTDLGFHYDSSESTNVYFLTVEVVKGGNTTVAEPYTPGTHLVPQGTTVQLEVILDPGYYLKQWIGSDDDTSTGLTNTVTVDGHKTVTIECDSIEPSLYTDVTSNNGKIYATLRDGTETDDTHTMHIRNTVVQLRAAPQDSQDRVKWTGTDDDTITGLYNAVTMTESKEVFAKFYTPRVLHVGSEGEYTDIQRAIDDAGEDDIVVIHPGEWETNTPGNGWVIEGKAITLTSTEPDNPAVVAQTILRNRIQIEDVGPDTIINGITILEVHYFGVDGFDGPETGMDGFNGSETFGSGLRIGYNNRLARQYPGLFPELHASPKVLNCVFQGCSNIGGNGGNGAGGSDEVPGGDGGWGGRAGGGAIFVGPLCNPTFKNCQFLDNFVDGGNGGNGGDAAPDNFGGVGGSWDNIPPWPGWTYGPYEPYWKYSGYGGALFCDVESAALFEDCTFSGNHTEGSLSGVNGLFMRYDIGPDQVYNIENFGGAIYCEANSNVLFKGCTITDNYADTSVEPFNDDQYVSYGGAVAFGEGANIRFEDCLFENNEACVGGSLYWEGAYATIADCNVVSSSAYQGGGAYFVSSETDISRCIFEENEATFDFAQGGGIFCFDSNSVFVDTQINNNLATGSGGGLYLAKNPSVEIRNCLITNNTAGVSGGGITSNWYSNTSIVNSTIADNHAERILPTQEEVIGGGILCSFNSSVKVADSIIWGNHSNTAGPQIAVSGTDPYNPLPATLEVSYSDVQDGKSGVYVDVGQNDPLWIGNINEDPLFETGLLGEYYLSHVQAGQSADSPCVDTGSTDVRTAGMDTYLTRTDNQLDRGVVDMGFHRRFAVAPDMCRVADMERDGIIDLPDLLILAEYWLGTGCSINDGSEFGWCHAADIDKSQDVDFYDYAFLTYCWEIEDTKPPQPNPMEWKDPPYPDGVGTISMTAETATDAWWQNDEDHAYIQYYFDCSDDAFDSDWVDEPEYTATGLVNGQQYSFRVQARDGRRREGPLDENRTEFSEWALATAGAETIPPEPDPSLWATLEHDGIDGIPEPSGPDSIKMAAYTATDPSGPVEYYFRYTEPDGVTPGLGDGHDSGWQLSNVYEDTGLTIDEFYTYVVRTRDAWGNETQESLPVTVLLDEWDAIPPEPNPPEWDQAPIKTEYPANVWWHAMSVQPATDDSGVEYYFDCIEDNDYDSGWQSVDGVGPDGLPIPPNAYWIYVGSDNVTLHYRVQVRDLSPNQNATYWSSTAKTY